jgi:hypothetical protein
MEDLEHCLARLGFRGVGREPECWQVAQVGGSERKRNIYQKQDLDLSECRRDLYTWMIETTEIAAQQYRVTRVAR